MDESQPTNTPPESPLNYDRAAIIRDVHAGNFLLCSLDDLETLLLLFLDFQRLDKDHLIATGLRRFMFRPSKFLDQGLANLYFTRVPCGVKMTGMNQEWPRILYAWYEGWPVKLRPIFADGAEDDILYTREIDIEWLAEWMLPTEPPRRVTECSRGVIAPFLRISDVLRIEGERALLFDIKETVLLEICRALKHRDASMLWKRCIEILTGKDIPQSFAEYYVQTDWQYRVMIGRRYTHEELAADQYPGGLSALFTLVRHVEQEINEPTWGNLTETWVYIRNLFHAKGVDLLRANYSQLVEVVDAEILDDFADWVSYLSMKASFDAGELLSAGLNVEMTQSFLTRPEHQKEVAKRLDDFRGTLSDFARNPVGLSLDVRIMEGGKVVMKAPGLYFSDATCASVRWIKKDGTEDMWPFSSDQAAAMVHLRRAWESGALYVKGDVIIEEIGTAEKDMRRLFKGHPAWMTLIKGGKSTGGGNLKGQYYLDP